MTMLEWALFYKSQGFSVIPVGKDKKPFIQWQRYQKEAASEQQIKTWWTQWPDANVGIVTGTISGLAVIDIDTDEGRQAIQEHIPDSLVIPVVNTPSGGQHYYFKCTDEKLSNNSRTVVGCDLRANGGYVLAPPSTNGTGKAYTWQEGLSIHQVALPDLPSDYLFFVSKKNAYINNSIISFKENVSTLDKNSCQQNLTKLTSANRMFCEGTRDNDLFNVANCLVKGGMPRDRILQVIDNLAKKCCNPPFPENAVPIKIRSALDRADRKELHITDDFREWVLLTSGDFLLTDAIKDLHLLTRAEKQNLYVAADRLCKEELIEKYGNKRGQYRRVESKVEDIDFLSADTKEIKLDLPFNIDEFVNIYPRNIIIIAGSPDSGKTAFLLNTARLNMYNHQISYFSSEMAEQELKLRLSKFKDIEIKEFTKVKWLERASNFADVVRPDGINIIDYLEVHEDFWRVGGMIREVFDKLKKGIAIIAIQKDKHKEHGLGATRGLEKARLYLTMNPGELTIIKAKNWRDPLINPNGMTLNFKLYQGCKFSVTKEWYK